MIFSLFNLEGIPQEVKIGRGGLAQLGERLPCKQEVSGSIPLISTIRHSRPNSFFKPMKCLKNEEKEQRNGVSFRQSRKRMQ